MNYNDDKKIDTQILTIDININNIIPISDAFSFHTFWEYFPRINPI